MEKLGGLLGEFTEGNRGVITSEKLGSVIGRSGDLATELNAEVRLVQLPAVTADPSSGTIPVGYWVWNTTSGHLKRHAGGYVWEIPLA